MEYYEKNYKIEELEHRLQSFRLLNEQFFHNFGKKWESDDLEILASLLFITKYTYSACQRNMKESIKELGRRKPRFDGNPLRPKYWGLLVQSKLI
jgi:hypothetical protein